MDDILSILTSIKKLLGIGKDYKDFDMDIIIHINAVFMSLRQMGVGPDAGFSIVDDTKTWINFVGEGNDFEAVKSYIYLKVRLLFDPPSNSFVIQSMNQQITEFEWRLILQAETSQV